MKSVIAYGRISTKDQSNFSLAGQEKIMRDYCERNCYTLTKLFLDDGQSAKNFDRAEWKILEQFIKENHKQVHALVVPKYDRFSRNLSEALQMIEKFEQQFGIEIISISEPIPVKRNSPMFFQLRTQYLLGAQVEWMIIRERTREGIYNATRNGRFINTAPLGYTNARDTQNKPVLVLHPEKSKIVKNIFEQFIAGTPMHELHKKFSGSGTFKSKFQIKRILSNPVYSGLIKVNAWNDQPAQLVSGIHTAIISTEQYYRAQQLLNPPAPNTRVKYSAEFPLRGVLHCECGGLVTAGNSTGKNKKVGYYFHLCAHRKNLNATKLHTQFDELLKHLSFTERQTDLLLTEVKKNIETRLKESVQLIATRQRDLQTVKAKIESVNEKFVLNQLDATTYHQLHGKYIAEKKQLENTISELKTPAERVYTELYSRLPALSSIYESYKAFTVAQKHQFVKMVFDNGLSYAENIYRTPYLFPIFRPKAAQLESLRLLKIFSDSKILRISAQCTPLEHPFELQTLKIFLQLLAA